jgi:hypothetical protein
MDHIAVIRFLSKPLGFALVNSQGHEQYHEFNDLITSYEALLERFHSVFGVVLVFENTAFIASHIASITQINGTDIEIMTVSNIRYIIVNPGATAKEITERFAREA